MNNNPHISSDAAMRMTVFAIQELVKTPTIQVVHFDQFPMISDAMGQPLPVFAGAKPFTQTYTVADLKANKGLKFEGGPTTVGFRIEGTFQDDWIPAPGMLHVYLCELRAKAGLTPAMPVQLVWMKFNQKTLQYTAISQGPILATPNKPEQGGIIKPN